MLPEAAWQRCYVHFLRNALDYVPRKVDGDCLRELRWFYDRRDLSEARRDLAAWLTRWQAIYPKLCVWVEEHIEETLAFYRLPRPHHKHLKSTNLLERLNEEIKRPTHVVRIFPNGESCLRWIPAPSRSRCMRTGWKRTATEHGRFARAREGDPAHGGLTRPTSLWTTLRVAHRGPPPQT